MGKSPREALALLQAAAADGRLDALCAKHDVRVLTVFGSTVRPDAHPQDLDVAIGFEPGKRGDVLALLDDLSRLTGSDDVDLLVLDDAGPVARERALVGCLALYESEQSAYALTQVAAMLDRMDTDWMRALDLQTLRS